MKKFVALLLALVMVFALAACGTDTTEPSSEPTTGASTEPSAEPSAAATENPYEGMSLEEIIPDLDFAVDGKLTVGTSPDFAPYEFYALVDGEPQLAGFDMALAQYIADALGVELNVVPMDFNGIIGELMTGNIDLGMAGFSPDPEREDSADFSDLYYMGGQSFVIRAADAEKYTSYEDFDGLSVGAQLGSIQYNLAMENTPNANIMGLTKVTDIVAELVSGHLEGAFIETVVAESYVKQYPDLMIAWEVEYDTEGSAVAVQEGDAAWLAAVNLIIADAIESGKMDEFVAEAVTLAEGEQAEWTAEGGLVS